MHLADVLFARGQQEHRHVRYLADLGEHLEPRPLRHGHVQHHHVRALFGEQPQPGLAVARFDDDSIVPLQLRDRLRVLLASARASSTTTIFIAPRREPRAARA